MSDLVIIIFEGRFTADDALSRIQRMESDWEVDLDEAVVLTRDKSGIMRFRSNNELTAEGFVGGTSLGALTGLLLGAAAGNPAAGFFAGSAVGAGSGTLAGALGQALDEDKLAESIGSRMKPDSSALAMIGFAGRPTKVLKALSDYKGEVIETSLSISDEKELRLALAD